MKESTNHLISKKEIRNQVFNVQVSEQENIRLQRLAKRVYPSNKAEAFRLSLRILEILVHELDEGSEFYIKRVDDAEPVKFDELLQEN